MAESNPCRYCVKPKRYPGCQDHCPEGMAWKKQHDEQKELEYKKRRVSGEIYVQRAERVTKAIKKHGRRK